MKRLGHYLKPGVRATAPGVIFTIVPSPALHLTGDNERDIWCTWGGADAYCAHWSHGRWGRFSSARCNTPAALFSWMHLKGDRTKRNYVFVPDGQASAAVCQLWDWVDNGKVYYTPNVGEYGQHRPKKYGPDDTLVRRCVVSPRCFLLDYARDGWRWLWLSAQQYFDAPEEALAKAVGFEWCDSGHLGDGGTAIRRTSNERAALWLKVFMTLADWWRANTKAPFGVTASSLSFGVLRTHVKPRALCTHTDPDVHQMERAACFGGMARTWYYGDIGDPRADAREDHPAPPPSEYGSIPGPMHLLDVRSMYPWLLREREYPTKLREYRENMTPSEPQAIARYYGVVARVTIETDRAEYPERVANRIYYRTGRFTTTLTGPELLKLRADGRVLHCHACAVYDLGTPFRDAAAALIRMREADDLAEHPGWELFVKAVANGLGGKLAQRRGEWVFRPEMAPKERFGEWYDGKYRRGKSQRFRAIAGIVQEWLPDMTGAGKFTAAFAYLAAHGRLHMRAIREAVPSGSVLSMDTDGLWVRDGSMDAILSTGIVRDERAGDLRRTKTSAAGRFYGPRHYFWSGAWVLAGFTLPTVALDVSAIRDRQNLTPICGPVGGPPRGSTVRDRTSRLGVEAHGVMIDRWGWAHPRYKG